MTEKLMAHPELEDLAAYIEGKLSPAERAAITAHLADCEECFQVFAEAVRIGQEEEDEAAAYTVPGGNPAPRPFEQRRTAFRWMQGGRRPAARWLPAAIAAVLVLGVGAAVYRSLTARPTISTPEIVASLPSVSDLGDETSHVRVTRGPGQGTDLSSTEAFQLGVLEVDLELGLAAKDWGAVEGVCRQIANALENDSLLADEFATFRQATGDLGSGKRPPDLPGRLRNALATAQPGLSLLYADFGRWAEAGRLSAKVGNGEFFEKRDNRRFLDWLLNKPARLEDLAPQDQEVVFPTQVQEALKRIEALWDQHASKSTDLRDSFDQIVKYYFETSQATGPD